MLIDIFNRQLYKIETAYLYQLLYDAEIEKSTYASTAINLTVHKQIERGDLQYNQSGQRLFVLYVKETDEELHEHDKIVIDTHEYIIEEVELQDANTFYAPFYELIVAQTK